MKVFLSHSSMDKGTVEAVADLLRPGTFELDSRTFDAGLLNSQTIIQSLKRCDLFCLFLSKDSVKSSYVDFEILLGIEFIASGRIDRFLVICLDSDAFSQASQNVKFFNIVRKGFEIESTARIIQGHLVSASKFSIENAHPFIGREDEILDLEKQISEHSRPLSKAIFISGNFGVGRRTIAKKFYGNHFPMANKIFPSINIELFSGLSELYRKILYTLRPAMTAIELKARIPAFDIAPEKEKIRLVAQILNSLLVANEATFLIDKGGILTDAGDLAAEINEIIPHLEARPHPPVIFISPRMIPKKLRRSEDDLSYLGVRSLRREATERLISILLRNHEVLISDDILNQLVELSDGHPFNIYRMEEEIFDRGIDAFLANTIDFVDWKHRHSSEYIKKIDLQSEDILILSLLKLIPELDFSAIVTALKIDAGVASDALLRLTYLHVIESSSDMFSVAPPLRVAVERDARIRFSRELQKAALETLARTLSIRLEDGTAPVKLIDAAVLSVLDSGGAMPAIISAFLLPSHQVWMAKRHYDQRNWDESIRYAREALKDRSRLSSDAFVAACRYTCLSAARLGKLDLFREGIRKLEGVAKNDWARSNVAFLNGFNLRMMGNLPKSEIKFREAYTFSPGNLSAAREIAAICLARGNLNEAELFAREAHSHAQSNPYLIDILISVLIRRHLNQSGYLAEINEMFEQLEAVGDEEGRSFYTTRKAEFELLLGNSKDALILINRAVNKTPNIFETRRLQAEILLKTGNRIKASEIINILRDMVNARDPGERRTNYRLYLETWAHYLTEISRFQEAKEIYNDQSMFTEDERAAAVREIEMVQGYKMR